MAVLGMVTVWEAHQMCVRGGGEAGISIQQFTEGIPSSHFFMVV